MTFKPEDPVEDSPQVIVEDAPVVPEVPATVIINNLIPTAQ